MREPPVVEFSRLSVQLDCPQHGIAWRALQVIMVDQHWKARTVLGLDL